MNPCRWDAEAHDYLTPEGDPCRHDDYGDPTHHCTARRSCSVHIGPDDLTCPRCVYRTRRNIAVIVELAPLAHPVAIEAARIDTEAMNLAGPAADIGSWIARRIYQVKQLDAALEAERITEGAYVKARNAMEDDDQHHPYTVLTRWASMLAEDYGHDLPRPLTTINAAAYLDRTLTRVAQDPHQDWRDLAEETRACRTHLEATLSVKKRTERGAPCPECTSPDRGVGPRLVRHYGHWCPDPDCEQMHYDTDEADVWECPADWRHKWSHADYERWVEERNTGRSA